MVKVVLAGPKHYLKSVTNKLYDLNFFHIVEHRKKDEVFGNFWVQRVRIIVMIIFKQINRTMSSNTYQETIMNKKLLITGGAEVFR